MIKRVRFPVFLVPYCISFEKSVGAVVFRVVGNVRQYLIIQYAAGHWEFPRGRVEGGEKEVQTMKREIREEIGIENLDVVEGFRKTMRFFYKAHGEEKKHRMAEKSCIFVHKKAVFYLVRAQQTDKIQLSHEHTKFLWLPFEEAYKKVTFSNAKKILIIAEKFLC